MLLLVILAKTDVTQIAALGSVLLAAGALYRSLTIDPRQSRLSERKENTELRQEVDQLYRDKRDTEAREREALRRLDIAERKIEVLDVRNVRLQDELDGANGRIVTLEGQVRHWRAIAGDIRGA